MIDTEIVASQKSLHVDIEIEWFDIKIVIIKFNSILVVVSDDKSHEAERKTQVTAK